MHGLTALLFSPSIAIENSFFMEDQWKIPRLRLYYFPAAKCLRASRVKPQDMMFRSVQL